MTDLVSVFASRAAAEGGRIALVDRRGEIGFDALEARAAGFAGRAAARGIGRGDRVLVAMPVGIDLFVALAACWRLGAVAVFPEPAMGLKGVRHAIAATRPKAFFAAGIYRALKLLPALWPLRLCVPGAETGGPEPVPLSPDDPALISFTSGSTGRPKAISRSHGFLMAQHAAVAPLLEGEGPDLVAFPVFTLVNLAAGRRSVLPDWRLSRPDRVGPEALASWIGRTGCRRALLPPVLAGTLARAERPGALRTVFTGGGPVKPALVAALRDRGLRVVSVYGSTEAEPIAELDWAEATDADLAAMDAGAGLLAGPPVPGLDLRLVDDEIQVAGAHVNPGYLDPAQDAGIKVREGGRVWHRTGDAGRLDDAGRLWLLGRRSAVVERDGARLFPFAVELAAEGWPGIARAALTLDGDGPVLAVEGAGPPDIDARAAGMGIGRVVRLDAIPLDRRHRSKIDYPALARRLSRRR
ncbi:AMP-binding protein [Rhodobacterales bacterium HKCCE2091]|nr:AMP-binding protein [Rhodobacterales bacterium HKCCE2091]